MSLITITVLPALILLIAAISLKKKSTDYPAFEAKKPLSNPEQILYHRLTQALPDKVILAQVSFSRFLRTKGGSKKENWRQFSKARQKVADYLICEKDFTIRIAIELDDSTHKKEKDERRDKYLASAGIKTVRWNVKNLPSKEQIQEAIKN